MRRCEIVPNSLASKAGRVEQSEIVGHARPITGERQPKQRSQQTSLSSAFLWHHSLVRNLLETPSGLHADHTQANDTTHYDSPTHPYRRIANLAQNKITREIKDDVEDIKERDAGGDLMV